MRGPSSTSAGCQDRPRRSCLTSACKISQRASQHAAVQLLGHSPRWQRGDANTLKCPRAQHLCIIAVKVPLTVWSPSLAWC